MRERRHVIEGDTIDSGDNNKDKVKKTEPKGQVN